MRTFLDVLGQIFRNLWAHKLRSFLAMCGIAWGVGSLLLLVGVGEGFRSGNRRELATLGEDVMFLFPGRAPAVDGHSGKRQYWLTYDDYLAIRREAPAVRNATPVVGRSDVRALSDFGNSGTGLNSVLPNFPQIRTVELSQGRWLNDADNEQRR